MRGFTYLEDETWLDGQMRRDRSGLPISMRQAEQVTRWLKGSYGDRIEAATKGTPIPPHVICAIACQETAYFWLPFVDELEPEELLGRCVLDASGDHPSSPRSAFPRNTSAFRQKYDDKFTAMLIEEANKTRALRDFGPKQWVYKGYGIFQYDLQFVVEDEDYFRERQWYDFDVCLAHVMHELDVTWKRHGELWEAVRAYNGSGSRAQQYKRNVKKFCEITEEVWATAPGPAKPASAPVPAPVPAPEPIAETIPETIPEVSPEIQPEAKPAVGLSQEPGSAPQATLPSSQPAAVAAPGPRPGPGPAPQPSATAQHDAGPTAGSAPTPAPGVVAGVAPSSDTPTLSAVATPTPTPAAPDRMAIAAPPAAPPRSPMPAPPAAPRLPVVATVPTITRGPGLPSVPPVPAPPVVPTTAKIPASAAEPGTKSGSGMPRPPGVSPAPSHPPPPKPPQSS